MPDRDWAKELAKIDRKLEHASDEALFPTRDAGAPPAARAENAAKQAATSTLGVVLRLLLATALGIGIYFWPYESRCGLGLAGYLGAVGVVGIAGAWSAVWSWRHRSGRAHVLSLLLALWGLVLAAVEVLPRIGYAKPDPRHPSTWSCTATPAPAPKPAPPALTPGGKPNETPNATPAATKP